MPQLNPTPWFVTLIMTWTIIAALMKITVNTPHVVGPSLGQHRTHTPHWPWTWQ